MDCWTAEYWSVGAFEYWTDESLGPHLLSSISYLPSSIFYLQSSIFHPPPQPVIPHLPFPPNERTCCAANLFVRRSSGFSTRPFSSPSIQIFHLDAPAQLGRTLYQGRIAHSARARLLARAASRWRIAFRFSLPNANPNRCFRESNSADFSLRQMKKPAKPGGCHR